MELTWSAIRLSWRRILPSPARRMLSRMAGTSRRAPRGSSGSRAGPWADRLHSPESHGRRDSGLRRVSAVCCTTGGGRLLTRPLPLRHNDRYSGRCVRGAARMADQAGSQIGDRKHGPGGRRGRLRRSARAEPGTLPDPGHQHAAFHGRPGPGWPSPSSSRASCAAAWPRSSPPGRVWVGVGLVAWAPCSRRVTDMFEDWY